MAERISRRAFGKHATIGITALAVTSAIAQTSAPEEKPKVTDDDVAKVEAQLSKPLTPEAKKLLKAAIEGSRKNGLVRMKTKLEDVSAPAIITPSFPAERLKL